MLPASCKCEKFAKSPFDFVIDSNNAPITDQTEPDNTRRPDPNKRIMSIRDLLTKKIEQLTQCYF